MEPILQNEVRELGICKWKVLWPCGRRKAAFKVTVLYSSYVLLPAEQDSKELSNWLMFPSDNYWNYARPDVLAKKNNGFWCMKRRVLDLIVTLTDSKILIWLYLLRSYFVLHVKKDEIKKRFFIKWIFNLWKIFWCW